MGTGGLPQAQASALPTRQEKLLLCRGGEAKCQGTLGFLSHQRLPDRRCNYFLHPQCANNPCHPCLVAGSPLPGGMARCCSVQPAKLSSTPCRNTKPADKPSAP